MKKLLIYIVLCLNLLSSCSKDIEPPFNPFLGTWEDFKIVYHFESEPKTLTVNIEVDYSRLFNHTIENDNGDSQYPCNIDLIPIRFTEEKYYRTYNYSNNDDCITKYLYENPYDFLKKNDSIYIIHFFKQRYYDHERNIDDMHDPPELAQISEVHVEKNILTFIFEHPQGIQINGRIPISSHYQIKRY